MTELRKITPVILSGGSGTRLWPLSRGAKPKQLLSLTDTESMLQLTARRTGVAERFEAPIVVANALHADIIGEQLTAVGSGGATLILEPAARNTAPAIALAALHAGPDALLLIMPSDHVIADVDSFRAAIDAAAPQVEQGWLATFGIAPDGPETGYGYIRIGAPITAGVHRAERFVEKPDRATAEAYLADGGYAWNGGIFLFRADVYLAALELHAPAIAEAARLAMVGARIDGRHVHPDPAAFAASPNESVDYAVMERAERVAVAPVEMGWSDLGSWDALHAVASKDADGNVHHGEVVAIDTSGCLIRTDGPLVAAVGVSDLIIVATRDAVLVMPRGSSQDIKRAIAALKRDGHVTLDR
jgi:mannose-1-phosphate guanylyltransferase/mannose-1-phosphate guanylyltransferase/mannose-6-phosphate isomerase